VVGLNGFAEKNCCIAKLNDREYPFRGLAQTCRLDAPTKGDLDDTVTPSDDRRHDAGRVGGWHPGHLSAGGPPLGRPLSALQLSEDEVRAYLLALRERGVALGTFKTHHGGIQFLYRRTLERDWPLFWKKRFARPGRNACPSSCRTLRSALCWTA
jgi:hypothetical protein